MVQSEVLADTRKRPPRPSRRRRYVGSSSGARSPVRQTLRPLFHQDAAALAAAVHCDSLLSCAGSRRDHHGNMTPGGAHCAHSLGSSSGRGGGKDVAVVSKSRNDGPGVGDRTSEGSTVGRN